MKKYLLSLMIVLVVVLAILSTGCDMSDKIEDGTYVCENPYIKFTYEFGVDYKITQEIEADGVVQQAITETGEGRIFFYEYQEEDIRPTDGLRLYDNETYAKFYYKFNDKTKQLILTDEKTGNVYHLDKVD